MRAAQHIAKSERVVSTKALSFEPILLPQGDIAAFQREMSRVASFRRDMEGMEGLKRQAESVLSHLKPETQNIVEGLLFKDVLLTQQAVLSAMLCAGQETGNPPGVMMTYGTESRREPARAMPQRDLWFEQVWKKCRKEQKRGNDGRTPD